MERYITDEYNGLKYEHIGDYYLIAGDDEPEEPSIGIWGQRHMWYLKQHKNAVYTGMLLTGKLDNYLRQIDEQAGIMFSFLVEQLSEREGIADQIKAKEQLAWVGTMNNIHAIATEIVNHELIYT